MLSPSIYERIISTAGVTYEVLDMHDVPREAAEKIVESLVAMTKEGRLRDIEAWRITRLTAKMNRSCAKAQEALSRV